MPKVGQPIAARPMPELFQPVNDQQAKRYKITLPQARILAALAQMRGPIDRNMVVEMVSSPGKKTATGDALGYSDHEKRRKRDAEIGHPCLLTQGLAYESELDLDGVVEVVFGITQAGREALASYGPIPPLRGT